MIWRTAEGRADSHSQKTSKIARINIRNESMSFYFTWVPTLNFALYWPEQNSTEISCSPPPAPIRPIYLFLEPSQWYSWCRVQIEPFLHEDDEKLFWTNWSFPKVGTRRNLVLIPMNLEQLYFPELWKAILNADATDNANVSGTSMQSGRQQHPMQKLPGITLTTAQHTDNKRSLSDHELYFSCPKALTLIPKQQTVQASGKFYCMSINNARFF